MNILVKLGDAIDSANHIDNESTLALGLFGPGMATTDSRSAPACSVQSRRRGRQRRLGW